VTRNRAARAGDGEQPMGRPMRPIDPADGAVQAFAAELRKLREQAGSPPFRLMARRAHYSATTLSVACAGTALPSLEVTLAFVRGGAGSGWAGNGPDDTLTRFDPVTGAVQATIRTPADAGTVLAGGASVWVTSYLGDELVKVSSGTNSVVGVIRLGSEPNGIVALNGYLWVTESGADEVAVVRPVG
jgi:hypothetical protein